MTNRSRSLSKIRYRQLLALIRHNRLRLLLAMCCSFLVAGTTAASAWLLKDVIDGIFIRQDDLMLKLMTGVVLSLFFIRGIGLYGQEYFMSYVGENVIRQLRDRLYDRIQDLPLAFFHKERTGGLMSRITNDVTLMRVMMSDAVKAAVRDFFAILGLMFVIFYRDWQLALWACAILPIAFFPVVKFGRKVRKVSTGCQECMADLNSFLHETLAGNKIVKAFGMEPHEKKRFFGKTRNLFTLELKAVKARAFSPAIMEFFAGLGVAFVIWYGGHRVISGHSTPGTFFSFIAAVFMLYDPVKKITRVNNAIQQGLAAADRVFDILERESDIKEMADAGTLVHRPHRVKFEEVSFSYDGDHDGGFALRGINLDVHAGEILALVGMSGGGKTSLVNLIPRFYDTTGGRICVDGIDVRKTTIASLRQQIAIVTQEPILFNDTVRNNIAYGNLHASEDDIVRASKDAYAYDFIKSFPKGFETTIGELGARLSGGEKQRLCIARALVKNAPILILDEATSALDAEAEALVQKALENLMQGRTTFVIAHRLSTIGHADRVVVLAGGRIVEEGRHQELIARQGYYHKLYQKQFTNGTPA